MKKILHLQSQTANCCFAISAFWRKANKKVKLFLQVTYGEWDKDVIGVIEKGHFELWNLLCFLLQPSEYIRPSLVSIFKWRVDAVTYKDDIFFGVSRMPWRLGTNPAYFWFKCDTEARVKAMLCVCSSAPSTFHGLQLSKLRGWVLLSSHNRGRLLLDARLIYVKQKVFLPKVWLCTMKTHGSRFQL